MRFQTNPWCWSPQLGFHRAADPARTIRLAQSPRSKPVANKAISAVSALSLGAGLGTGNHGCRGMSELFPRLVEVTEGRRLPDVEPIAVFSHDVTGSLGLHPGDLEVRSLLVAAVGLFADDIPGKWGRLTSSALAGTIGEPAVRNAEMASQSAYESGRLCWGRCACEPWEAYVLGDLVSLLARRSSGGIDPGGARTVSRAFAICEPSAADVAAWLGHISTGVASAA